MAKNQENHDTLLVIWKDGKLHYVQSLAYEPGSPEADAAMKLFQESWDDESLDAQIGTLNASPNLMILRLAPN